MDLFSLDGDERYHPLAALVDIGTDDLSEIDLSGIVLEDDHKRISRILHEITHVASLRTTRLGFWVARISNEILKGRTEIPDGPLDVPVAAQRILGAFAPLLEGLALYAQLDYAADNSGEVLPFPLNKVVVNNTGDALRPDLDIRRVMHLASIATIWDGTLAALFLLDEAGKSHYMVGYLYVKALAAKIARVTSSLSDPATMLPLLVRLLCDHPILERASDDALSAIELIEAVHETTAGLDAASLGRIERMLDLPEVRANFDNWDIHAQLAAPDGEPLILHRESNPIFKGVLNELCYQRFRSATNAYLTSWAAGVPVSMTIAEGKTAILLRNGHKETEVHILLYSCLNAFRPHLEANALKALEQFEEMILRGLRYATDSGLQVAVGNYLTLTKGNIGMALWVDDNFAGILPLSLLDNRLDSEEVSIAMGALKLSPVLRRAFARRLRRGDDMTFARVEANDVLMAALVSDRAKGDRALRRRLSALLPEALRSGFADWCVRSLSPGEPNAIDPAAVAALSAVFDRPSLGGGSFTELLPKLDTLRNSLYSLMSRR